MRNLPELACKLAYSHEAWVVGSAADPNLKDIKTCDIDILVPYAHWQSAAALIPANAIPNSFGGWKCKNDDIVIDIWPGDLAWFMTNKMPKYLWHPRSGARWQRLE